MKINLTEYPIYTQDCGCGEVIEVFQYEESITCKCGITYDHDYCDHPEIPGNLCEHWLIPDVPDEELA